MCVDTVYTIGIFIRLFAKLVSLFPFVFLPLNISLFTEHSLSPTFFFGSCYSPFDSLTA